MSGFVFGFLLLLGVSLLHGQNKSINLVNWERTDSSAYFGSVSYSALNARVTFDEDLFLTRDPFCSRHYEPKTLTCIPCNYSGPSDAGFFLFFSPPNLQRIHLHILTQNYQLGFVRASGSMFHLSPEERPSQIALVQDLFVLEEIFF